LKPGNAGGAKGPDFWCAFEDGEVTVSGDKPVNTNYDPGPSVKAVSKAEGESRGPLAGREKKNPEATSPRGSLNGFLKLTAHFAISLAVAHSLLA
jgi:hypothetical protein